MESASNNSPSNAQHPRVEEVVHRASAEFREMPGLCLTRDQARRLWGLDRAICDAALARLVETRFLRQTSTGSFVRNLS